MSEQTELQAKFAELVNMPNNMYVQKFDGLVWRFICAMSRSDSDPAPVASTNFSVQSCQSQVPILCTPSARDGAKDAKLPGCGTTGAMDTLHYALSDGEGNAGYIAETAELVESGGQGVNPETFLVNALLARMFPGKTASLAGWALIEMFGSKKALCEYLSGQYGDADGAEAVAGMALALHRFVTSTYEYSKPEKASRTSQPAKERRSRTLITVEAHKHKRENDKS